MQARVWILAFVASAGTLGGLGLIAPAALPEGVPEAFPWDAPRAGDRAEYAYSIVRQADEGLETAVGEEAQLRFAYAGPHHLLDSAGQPHPVRALTWAERPLFGWSSQPTQASDIHDLDEQWLHPDVAYLHLHDGRVVGAGTQGAAQDPPRPGREGREHQVLDILLEEGGSSRRGARPPCVATTLAPEAVTDLRRPVTLWRDCTLGTHLVVEGTFRPVSAEAVDGVPCVTFASVRLGPDQWPLTSPRAWATYCPDRPFPVRVAFQHWRDGDDQPDISAPTYSVLRLSGLTRGPPPSTLGPAPEPAAPLDLAPRQLYGPSETAVKHPFPLSAAYEALRASPETAPAAASLATAPDAYVQEAQYSERVQDETVERSWFLVLTDGQALGAADVRQVQTGSESASVAVEAIEMPEGASGTRWPDAADLPDEIPSVASLAQAFARHWEGMADATTFNAWGIRIEHWNWACGNGPDALSGDRDCTRVRVDLSAGWTQEVQDADGASRLEQRFLRVDWTPEGQSRSLRLRYEAAGAWLAPDPAPTPTFSIEATVAQRPDLWRFPPAAWALLAGAAGAVVLAAARWTPLALAGFSRLMEPGALAHPARSRIVEAVDARPGIHTAELVRATGLAEGTLRHHLRQLRLLGILVRGTAPGYACYFRRGAVDRRLMDAAPLTRSDWAAKLLAEIERTPGASLTQLSAALGAAPTTLHHHVAALRRAGLVAGQADGRTLRLHVTELGRQARALTGANAGT